MVALTTSCASERTTKVVLIAIFGLKCFAPILLLVMPCSTASGTAAPTPLCASPLIPGHTGVPGICVQCSLASMFQVLSAFVLHPSMHLCDCSIIMTCSSMTSQRWRALCTA